MKYHFILLFLISSIVIYSKGCYATEILLEGGPSSEDIFFETGSYKLSSEAKNTLSKKVQHMRNHGAVDILIEGHCDKRGSETYNYKLGLMRAKAVRDYFIIFGIAESRITIISYGEMRPVSFAKKDWRYNRRVTIKYQRGNPSF